MASAGESVTGRQAEYIINIPIVFNCTGNLSQANDPNLTDFQLEKQVEQLNLDFQARNHDYTSKCPANMLDKRAGDLRINFYIQDIRRRYTNTLGSDWHSAGRHRSLGFWSGGQWYGRPETMKLSGDPVRQPWADDSGGLDPLQTDTAMNVWCCYYSTDGTPSLTKAGSSGYAYYPSTLPPIDNDLVQGIIMQSVAIGSVSHPAPNAQWGSEEFGTGRVLTHEVGHYLNLWHVWGNGRWDVCELSGGGRACGSDGRIYDIEASCGGFDYTINVTPPALFNRGCGNEPYNNHMNYGVGRYQSAFTPNQASLMRQTFSLYRSHERIGTAIRPMDCNRLKGLNYGTAVASRAYRGGALVWDSATPDPDPPDPPAPAGDDPFNLRQHYHGGSAWGLCAGPLWTQWPGATSSPPVTWMQCQYKTSTASNTWLSTTEEPVPYTNETINGVTYSTWWTPLRHAAPGDVVPFRYRAKVNGVFRPWVYWPA